MIQTILVGVDGTEGSRRALVWAAGRAQELGAEVVAVLAIRPFGEFVSDVPPLPGDVVHRLRKRLETTWCAPLRDAGVRYRSIAVEDDPSQALVSIADRERADMIVLGARGHGRMLDRLLGSVTYKVAHRAHCPVVIVPSGDAP